MRVARDQTPAVVDLHHVAIAATWSSHRHRAGRRGLDRGAVGTHQVDAGMQGGASVEGIKPHTERRRHLDPSLDRLAQRHALRGLIEAGRLAASLAQERRRAVDVRPELIHRDRDVRAADRDRGRPLLRRQAGREERAPDPLDVGCHRLAQALDCRGLRCLDGADPRGDDLGVRRWHVRLARERSIRAVAQAQSGGGSIARTVRREASDRCGRWRERSAVGPGRAGQATHRGGLPRFPLGDQGGDHPRARFEPCAARGQVQGPRFIRIAAG